MDKILRDKKAIVIFIAPALTLFIAVLIIPMFQMIYYSLCDYAALTPPKFIGFENYKKLFFKDATFRIALKNSIFFMVFSAITQQIVGLLLAVIYLAPLLWMLSVSFKDNAEVMNAPFSLPSIFHWENFQQAWTMGKLGNALVNSVLVCGVTLVVSMFLGAMAAFAIARMRWKLSEAAHTFFLIGMMVPVHCILIPLFVRFAKLGLTNSRTGLMIPYITFSLPMTIFLLTGFFKSMPGELFEAAAIDLSLIHI